MMRYFKLVVLSSFVFSLTSAFAEKNSHPYEVGVYGEYLYVLPSVGPTYFVLDGDGNADAITGDRLDADFQYKSAFRIGGGVTLCDCLTDLTARWTHLNTSYKRSVEGSDLSGLLVGPGFASVEFVDYAGSATNCNTVKFDSVDIELSRYLLQWRCLDLFATAGFQYAYGSNQQESEYLDDTAQIFINDQKSTFRGYGLQVGLDLVADLFCDIYFRANGRWGLLASEYGFRQTQESNTTVSAASLISMSNEKFWHVIPMGSLKFGLGYGSDCWCCVKFDIEAGYEFTLYEHVLPYTKFTSNSSITSSVDTFYNYTMQGLYVKVGLRY